MDAPLKKSYVIQASTGHFILTPLGFHRYATDFLMAVKNLKASEGFSPVPYYLCCRSIELSLKAFLLGKGVTKKILKERLGHDLIKVWNLATSKGLSNIITISKAQESCLRSANRYYVSKGFEYFDIGNAVRGYNDRPSLEALEDMASDLVAALDQYCQDIAGIGPSA